MPAVILSGDAILGPILGFAATVLVVAPVALALLAFGAWILCAPSDSVRWSEAWVAVGASLGLGVWLLNLVTEAAGLCAWFLGGVTLVPRESLDRSVVVAISTLIAPGVVLSSIGLAVAYGLVSRSRWRRE